MVGPPITRLVNELGACHSFASFSIPYPLKLARMAHQALIDFEKTLKATFFNEAQVIKKNGYSKPGRPSKKKEPDHHSYQISGAIASCLDVHQQRLQRKSCFILATNQMNMDDLSDEALLANYKSQQKVERGFRFMKDPLFMASTLFLTDIPHPPYSEFAYRATK